MTDQNNQNSLRLIHQKEEDSHLAVDMDTRILQLFPNSHQQQLDLLAAPSQIPSEQGQAVRLEAVQRRDLLVSPEFLELLVACPRTQRYLLASKSLSWTNNLEGGGNVGENLINVTSAIGKARLGHFPLERLHDVHLLPELLGRLV